MASSSELEKRPAHGVDPHDEPSAEWGWHGQFPKATRIAGLLTALALLGMLIGNHRGHIEDIYLVATAAVIVIALIWDRIRSRTSWRR
ncbi:DUF2631 domain-containing protein [Kutzneria viridogrisea]|uniref:DUF2631 domain-containing protein n=2 Tax=Kutzneria TaxID=43356 RepID=W5WIV3_9PSEU|nr:DUF2631 domain-containing protein [Kutzneria albida]AHI00646.1 hypothetical protein KALB_7288 [Kutzneria albida DSM 43870]MBA8925825.1 hypothetical protein [Kutzneria viridogrisea]